MLRSWSLGLLAALAVGASAFAGAQAGGGHYDWTGYQSGGSSDMDPGGASGTCQTPGFGSDYLMWDPSTNEHWVYDGGSTGPYCGEIVLTTPAGAAPPKYFAQYYDAQGAPVGSGSWN